MSVRDAEYVQRNRRLHGIQSHDPFSVPDCPRQAIEARSVEQLPWPRNLFGELATITELMAESGQNTDGLCLSIGMQEAN